MTAQRKARFRLDPWTEMVMYARSALRGHASIAGASDVARFCGYPVADGAFKPNAQALNALRLLVLQWRDTPAEARTAMDAAITGLLDALDAWPAHLRVSLEDLATQRRERAASKRTRQQRESAPVTPPYWIND